MSSDRELEIGARSAIEQTFRNEHGKIVAILVRDFGDIDLAEEALQEASAEALRVWPNRGTPPNPAAWIVTTARRRAIDRLRRAAVGDRKLAASAVPGTGHDDGLDSLFDDEEIPDERLRLIFTCCHPAISRSDSVALTLRVVAGVATTDIARMFLVKETAMQARLTRAKAKVRKASIPYRVPEHHELPDRLAAVNDVVLLIYNQGYTPPSPDAIHASTRAEAIGLAAVLSSHLPDEPEALGLHSLLLFHETRAKARFDRTGQLASLEEQDRSLWDHSLAKRADGMLQHALRLGRAGPMQLQAAISGIHSLSPRADHTDWAEIVVLYDRLLAVAPSPVTAIGRAVAVGMARGPKAGLASLPAPDPPIDGFHRWHAARADLLRRAGNHEEASDAFARAASLATNPAEVAWLRRQCADS